MIPFDTKRLPVTRDEVAPDGSDVRILLNVRGGGMAHFELAPGQTSKAVTHRTVEDIWFFRSIGEEPLSAMGVTMPPWPGEGEAMFVQEKWDATVA
jgi:mannose-6-phosphate isomerase-like protein (cupin superfamily)